MGRVSLTEDYDDRSVISKLNEMDKRVKENTSVVTSAEASAKQSAQAAQETADRFAGSVGAVVQNANAQINASKAQVDQAKAEVDEAVTTVAQAVQTANNASASAQASAQTVAGYENRVTALETADGQNVKLSGSQSITGIKTVPTEPTGTLSKQVANSAKIGAELDNYSPMVRTTGNQRIAGNKEFIDNLTAIADKGYNRKTTFDWPNTPTTNQAKAYNEITDANGVRIYIEQLYTGADGMMDKEFILYNKTGQNIRLIMGLGADGKGKLLFRDTKGTTHTIFQEP